MRVERAEEDIEVRLVVFRRIVRLQVSLLPGVLRLLLLEKTHGRAGPLTKGRSDLEAPCYALFFLGALLRAAGSDPGRSRSAEEKGDPHWSYTPPPRSLTPRERK